MEESSIRAVGTIRGGSRSVLAVAPGWVRTDMGGPDALPDIDTSVLGIAEMIAARKGQPGSAYVDDQGNEVAW